MRFDARSKILLVIFAGVTYGMHVTALERGYLLVGIAICGLLEGRIKMALVTLLGYLAVYQMSQVAMLPMWLFRFTFMLSHIWVPLMAGHFLLLTTSAYELIHGLRKWYLPESFLLTLGVMFRFLPLIKKEVRVIQTSLKTRGIFLRKYDFFLQPHRYIEYVLVPLMMSLLRSVQDLTIATLTKGLAVTKRPSEFVLSHWTWLDWSVCAWCLSFLILKFK
ncbi:MULTISPECIES: energy-coupling factor transporter transmembrane component T [unclassified Streptococcus]|uniref:energy-coupling factor transporter transmembrane component T n=1 Tax=unclassified Streptococcus TaxID=2608887 RepID=UPI001071CC81|nr:MULTISPECIES: energy-coupling factor transporter transmembrane component T [unclassified Streptococcus]MBF0787821.1 energy-coupling factor transporter transmembrane protein EcfT [Streptococcus sp. 19428wC2_LYSM12]MCQ9211177.1 energy-coupling factor transporter transmembrane protein EcfT [Streptococcus sp. B01]MCQ9214452.1 energy-coupling factor transporter transmembrane protein EcfT [Streptococcus sp. O1]TFV05144.1 energy-coupling factor transporter transmembrane protein EcfT [Streptococcus 